MVKSEIRLLSKVEGTLRLRDQMRLLIEFDLDKLCIILQIL